MDVTLHKHALKKKNVAKGTATNRYNTFFSEITKELISELYEYCKRDYEMFGYPQLRAMTSQMNVKTETEAEKICAYFAKKCKLNSNLSSPR